MLACDLSRDCAMNNKRSKTPRSRTPRAGTASVGGSVAGAASALDNIYSKLQDVEKRLKDLGPTMSGDYKGEGGHAESESREKNFRSTRTVTKSATGVFDDLLLSGDVSDNDVSAKPSNAQASGARRPVKTGLVCMMCASVSACALCARLHLGF